MTRPAPRSAGAHPWRARFVAVLLGAGASACNSAPRFDQPLVLGGVTVAPDVLNTGHALFERYCATCHGSDGRADTPAGRQLEPHPRDFTRADFKYKAVPGAGLPTDADLAQTIHDGVAGTGMPPWPGLSDRELTAIIQYLKVFSPCWRTPTTDRTVGSQTLLPVSEAADSVRPGQPWRGDATTTPHRGLAQRAPGALPAVARGER